jgi:hypothetical protein
VYVEQEVRPGSLILEALLSMDSMLEQGRSIICCQGNLYSGVLVSPLVEQGDATAAEGQPTQLCGVATQLDGPSIVGSEVQLSSGYEAQTLGRGRLGDVKAFNWCPVDHSNHAVHSSADPQRVSVADRGRVPLQVFGSHGPHAVAAMVVQVIHALHGPLLISILQRAAKLAHPQSHMFPLEGRQPMWGSCHGSCIFPSFERLHSAKEAPESVYSKGQK